MLRLAKDLTIERMSVTELLELMSPVRRARSLTFNGAAGPGDFPPKAREGPVRESTGSNSFRKRTPLPRRNRPKRG
jgi:hypothetical protein